MFFLNSAVPYLFIIPALVLIYALITRRRTAFIATLVPAVLFLGLYGARFQPRPTPLKTPEMITVMTHNLNAFNDDTGALRDLTIRESVDVLFLQELGRWIQPITPKDLEESLPNGIINPTHNLYGMGIFSQFPITEIVAPELEPFSQHTQAAILTHPSGDILLVNIHNISVSLEGPSFAEKTRREMIERQEVARATLALIKRIGLPAIVAGDFNSTEFSRTHARYETQLIDVWDAEGQGFGHTFPGGPVRPKVLGIPSPEWYVRIDYVFVTPDFTVEEAHVGYWNGMSDHRPVVTTLTPP